MIHFNGFMCHLNPKVLRPTRLFVYIVNKTLNIPL